MVPHDCDWTMSSSSCSGAEQSRAQCQVEVNGDMSNSAIRRTPQDAFRAGVEIIEALESATSPPAGDGRTLLYSSDLGGALLLCTIVGGATNPGPGQVNMLSYELSAWALLIKRLGFGIFLAVSALFLVAMPFQLMADVPVDSRYVT